MCWNKAGGTAPFFFPHLFLEAWPFPTSLKFIETFFCVRTAGEQLWLSTCRTRALLSLWPWKHFNMHSLSDGINSRILGRSTWPPSHQESPDESSKPHKNVHWNWLSKGRVINSIQPWSDSDSFPEFQLEKPTMGSSANHAEKSKRLMPVGFGDWRENSARQEHLFFVVLKREFVHSEKWVLGKATHSREKGRFMLASQRLRTAPVSQAYRVPWRNRIYMKGRRRPVPFFAWNNPNFIPYVQN